MPYALPLPEEEFMRLPIMALGNLHGNDPVVYTELQKFMLPWLGTLHTIWWVTLIITSAVLLTILIRAAIRQRGMVDPGTPRPEGTGFTAAYERFFGLEEIRRDPALLLFGGAILLGYLYSFADWQMSRATTVDALQSGNMLCWPFFQSCGELAFLKTLPVGYSQTTLFMVLFGFIVLGAYGLLARRMAIAHISILLLFLARLYFTSLNFGYNANYDYYHIFFSVIFLFFRQRRFFASVLVVLFYFLSTVAKIHPSWTWGGYFTALKTGLPIFPDGIEPILTNTVIFMEMVMAWFLFSKNKLLQRGVFAFFCFFHLYSGTLVGYHYPIVVMPALLIFFGPLFKPFETIPFGKRSIAGWSLVSTCCALQLSTLLFAGDIKLTFEGNFYGLYMFEANHQCRIVVTGKDERPVMYTETANARWRCAPWIYLSGIQRRHCGKADEKLNFVIDHSINGGPFYRIVDEPDACALKFHPFERNSWVKDETSAPIQGRPLQNFYR